MSLEWLKLEAKRNLYGEFPKLQIWSCKIGMTRVMLVQYRNYFVPRPPSEIWYGIV